MLSDNTEDKGFTSVRHVLLRNVEWEANTSCYMTTLEANQISILLRNCYSKYDNFPVYLSAVSNIIILHSQGGFLFQ